ncbi:MAG: hypothetical protein LBF12_00785, partial [Christensenellaceae bacterium]|nr:hypothetical protein [Christensenellaceae bacterium]
MTVGEGIYIALDMEQDYEIKNDEWFTYISTAAIEEYLATWYATDDTKDQENLSDRAIKALTHATISPDAYTADETLVGSNTASLKDFLANQDFPKAAVDSWLNVDRPINDKVETTSVS